MARLYPAALPLMLATVWIAFHASFVLDFAAGHTAHYSPAPLVTLTAFPWFVFGQGFQAFMIVGLIAFTSRYWWGDLRNPSPEALLIWTGIAAFVLILAMGLLRATLMPRYFTPGIPALLFGVACWAERVRSKDVRPAFFMFAVFFAAMAATLVTGPNDMRFRERRNFQFETASAWLMERSPDRLLFLWPTPTGAQSKSKFLAEIAGFFFARAGHPVKVEISRGGTDPNRALIAAAGSDPRATILWMSDNRTAADVKPTVDRQDRSWECRDFGGENILVYACRRKVDA
ncbi:MAG: hypothetical protein LC656_11895 [Sphingomonadales bacterium]|nr:hypothetical protein [Sphingomonadales bacterium]